jgi:hypothetical protein
LYYSRHLSQIFVLLGGSFDVIVIYEGFSLKNVVVQASTHDCLLTRYNIMW